VCRETRRFALARKFPIDVQGVCENGRVFDWDDLRVVIAAAQTRSLVGAARELGVKHSTVGRRLDALEEALGLRLFLRDRQGLTLTEAGTRVLGQASEIQRLAVGIERTMVEPDDAFRGTVRLTTSESFTHFLVRRLAPLRALHEDLIVEVLTTNAPVDLLNRQADIAVRFVATAEQSLMQRRIGTIGWSLYASKSYLAAHGRPPSASDLRGHRVVGFDTSMAGVPGAKWLEEHGDGTRVVMKADSLIAVMNATAMGIGLGLLPCFLESADANLVRIDDRVLGTRAAWLVAHPDVARIPRVRTVIEFLVAMMKEEATVLSGEAPTTAA